MMKYGAVCLLTVVAACSSDSLQSIPASNPLCVACGTGTIQGRSCDVDTGEWLSGAQITLDDGAIAITDALGRFSFREVSEGDHVITVTRNGDNRTYTAEVTTAKVTVVGELSCSPPGLGTGSVSGRACAGRGIWLGGAEASITLSDGTVLRGTTDSEGRFTINGIPEGSHTVVIEKGSFITSFAVMVAVDSETSIPEPVCTAPTARVAVVEGIFDHVEDILVDLGHVIRARYDESGETMIDADGTVDLIKGTNGDNYATDGKSAMDSLDASQSSYWLNTFLADPVWLQEYDVIFVNCGAGERPIDHANTDVMDVALANLRDYIAQGGALYSSDWASEVVRLAFPDDIKWESWSTSYNDSYNRFADARIGVEDASVHADVNDPGLVQALGKSEVDLSFDLDSWVVMDSTSKQPDSTEVLLDANIRIYEGYGTASRSNTAIVVRFFSGEGRVIYTSVHNEANATADLTALLTTLVFEL